MGGMLWYCSGECNKLGFGRKNSIVDFLLATSDQISNINAIEKINRNQ